VKRVFADTGYFVALMSADDALHQAAVDYAALLEIDATTELVTTDAVLVEVLNSASRGSAAREKAAALVQVLRSSAAHIEPQTRDLLNEATELYASRLDKNWSVTDCMSLVVMDQLEIDDALSGDHCFEQAGKRALLRGGT
jgi:predicted nucleic acid-binding protein